MSEAERRQREEQIRERQELARQQLRKWKEEENTKKQLSVGPEVKARPASADPGEYFVHSILKMTYVRS